MKRKHFKKFTIRKNSKGYWEKGGGCETELLVAVVCLGLMVLLIGSEILTRLFWG